MRIGFTGASGSGKSTLVEKLIKELPHYNRYKNIQRQLTEALPKFPTSKSTNNISQSIITANIAISLLDNENLIADRTLLDTFVYSTTSPGVTLCNEIIDMFEDLISLYDIIFYCPYGEFDLVKDGIRENDNQYHIETDNLIQEFIKKYETKTKIIKLSGSINERYDIMMSQLKEINAV